MIKLISIILLVVLFLAGCAVTGTLSKKGKVLKLEGFGAKSASWEIDGNKYSISKGEPFKVPDILPVK